MESSVNYLGYSTYLTNSAENLSQISQLLLYNESELLSEVGKISTYNLEDVYYNVIKSGKYYLSTKVNDLFPYQPDSSNSSGFNVIIYITSQTNTVVGYTKFMNTQGQSSDVNLYIDLKTSLSDSLIKINISNSLNHLRSNGTRIITGKSNKDYLSYETFMDSISQRSESSSTVDIVDSNKNNKPVYLSSGVFSESQLIKLPIIPTSIEGFSKFYIGICNNDVAALIWNDQSTKFSIVSMTKVDNFNHSVKYTEDLTTGSSIKTLPLLNDSILDQSILSFDNNYISVLVTLNYSTSKIFIYDYVNEYWLSDLENYVIINEQSNEGLISLPQINTFYNLFQCLPMINNQYLDIEDFIQDSSISILRVVNNHWLVFTKTTNTTNSLIVSNPFGYFEIPYTKGVEANLDFINNKTLLLHESLESVKLITIDEGVSVEKSISLTLLDLLNSELMNYSRKSTYSLMATDVLNITIRSFKGLLFILNQSKNLDYI